MNIAKKIKLKDESRKLETISKGDILIFTNGRETVQEVDLLTGCLYTERIKKVWNRKIRKQIIYSGIKEIFPKSKGYVYGYIRN